MEEEASAYRKTASRPSWSSRRGRYGTLRGSVNQKTRYITTVIDLYSRLSYAECEEKIVPGLAAKAVLNAQRAFGFKFETVQSDNGLEFTSYFSERLKQNNIKHRHTRVRQPNDNAHIERFNRTLRQECIGEHMSYKHTNETINAKLRNYLDYYNLDAIIWE